MKSKDKLSVQDKMIKKYIDEESDVINNLYPIISDNGERDWGKIDAYIPKYEKSRKIAELIQSQVLDGFIKDETKKVKRLKSDSLYCLSTGGFFIGLSLLIGLTTNGNFSLLNVLAISSSIFSSSMFAIKSIIKDYKAAKLTRQINKLKHEWEILHLVPNYMEDFCKYNHITIKDFSYGDFENNLSIKRECANELIVTTEERYSQEELYSTINEYLISNKQQEKIKERE